MTDSPYVQRAKLGALALHLGSTLEERRERTAAARAARAAKKKPAGPTMAERIAAAEALLPDLDPDERARQEAWITEARAMSAAIAAHREPANARAS